MRFAPNSVPGPTKRLHVLLTPLSLNQVQLELLTSTSIDVWELCLHVCVNDKLWRLLGSCVFAHMSGAQCFGFQFGLPHPHLYKSILEVC